MSKREQAPSGKSVADITREIEHLSEADKDDIKVILDEVRKQLRAVSHNGRNPDLVELRNILKQRNSYKLVQLCMCLAEICHAVKRTKRYFPKTTQLVSLCLLIKSSQEGRLLEIKTGEGKSCIIAMFAVFLALSGRSVDIVTSSPILAERDAKEWLEFYQQFKIGVDCNSKHSMSKEDLRKCYKKQVVYGTVGDFSGDILRQEFLMEDVRGDRQFDAVIVDEVDSMLLDQGPNFTYLSSPAPGMHHIQPILLMIWNEVIRHPVFKSDLDQNFFVGKKEPFHAVLSRVVSGCHNPLDILCLLEEYKVLRNGFTKDMQEKVDMNQNENSFFKKEMTKEKMLECLLWVESNFQISIKMFQLYPNDLTIHKINTEDDPVGKQADLQLLIVGEGLVCVLYENQKELCELIKNKIESFLTTECQSEEDCSYEFPSYLSDFVHNRLSKWINNAFRATCMTEGREYLVKDREIVPVDYESTGVVEMDRKWGGGLHQFLELKHQTKNLSQLRLVTNFMSNQAFFKRYPGRVFGLSGTLGRGAEMAFLEKYYGLSYVRIPTYLEKRFSENPGILCSTKVKWLESIGKKVKERISSQAVLIICGDINTAKEVKESLTTLKCNSVTLFTENEEEGKAVGRKLIGGDVVIATNIAGRGTDIEIDESVVDAGGLFVLVTFLPSNSRVEDQAFGRCGRKGQPGSAQLVVNKESLPMYLQKCENVQQVKRIREEIAELVQTRKEKVLYSETIPKEELFSIYCHVMRDAALKLNDESESEKKILLSSMHEFWGLWLEMNCENLKDLTKLKRQLRESLPKAKSQILNRTSPCANLYHIIKFANQRRRENKVEEAYKLYTKAIETNKPWAAIAYYNRAYCRLLQQEKGYMEEAISDFIEAKKSFLKFNEEVKLSISLLSISPKDTKSATAESTTTMKSQFEARGQILNFYEKNIETAITKLEELKREKKDAKAVGHDALAFDFGDDICRKKLDSELDMFWNLGLTEIVSIEEKRRGFNWKAALVALFGVLQVAVGALVVACSSGMLLNIGWGLVTEGINDFCTGARAFWNGDHNFVKSWAIGKAASIAISIAAFGFGQVKSLLKGTKDFKSVCAAIKEKVETAAKEIGTAVKEVSSKSFPAVMRKVGEEVAVHAVKEVGTRLSKFAIDSVNQEIKKNFEKETRKQLNEELGKAMSNGEFKDSLDRFIFIQSRKGKKKEEISDAFMKIHKPLLQKTISTGQLRSILSGCVKSSLKVVKTKMEEKSPKLFEGLLCPILDIVDTCQEQSLVNVKQLVSVYCKQVVEAINKKTCADDFKDIPEQRVFQSQKTAISDDVKLIVANEIEDDLFELIQQSLKKTSGSLLVQNSIESTVLNLSEKNGVGKNIVHDISSISKRSGEFLKDRQAIANAGLGIAKKGVNMFGSEQAKKTVDFVSDAAGSGAKLIQSKDRQAIANGGLGIVKKGVNMFGSEQAKKTVDFVSDAAGSGAKLIQSKDRQAIANGGLGIVKKGVNMFGSQQAKKTVDSLSAVREGGKAIQSKDRQAIANGGLGIAKKGIKMVGLEGEPWIPWETRKPKGRQDSLVGTTGDRSKGKEEQAMINNDLRTRKGLDPLVENVKKTVGGSSCFSRDSSRCQSQIPECARQKKLNSLSSMSKRPVCNREMCCSASETQQKLINVSRRKYGKSSLALKINADRFVAAICNRERDGEYT